MKRNFWNRILSLALCCVMAFSMVCTVMPVYEIHADENGKGTVGGSTSGFSASGGNVINSSGAGKNIVFDAWFTRFTLVEFNVQDYTNDDGEYVVSEQQWLEAYKHGRHWSIDIKGDGTSNYTNTNVYWYDSNAMDYRIDNYCFDGELQSGWSNHAIDPSGTDLSSLGKACWMTTDKNKSGTFDITELLYSVSTTSADGFKYGMHSEAFEGLFDAFET